MKIGVIFKKLVITQDLFFVFSQDYMSARFKMRECIFFGMKKRKVFFSKKNQKFLNILLINAGIA